MLQPSDELNLELMAKIAKATREGEGAGYVEHPGIAVVEKMIKQRKDSIAQFEAGKRPDLAVKERAEIDVLHAYMPAQASDAEIDAEIAAALAASGASGMAAMGKVMAVLKPKLAGRADMGAVSARVKTRLAN